MVLSRWMKRLILALTIWFGLGGSTQPTYALADSGTGTLSVTGGGLFEVLGAISIPSVTLTGSDQTVVFTLPVTVTDATGSGAGWYLTITSTQFTTGAHLLPTTATSIHTATASCSVGSTCVLPTNTVGFPVTLPAAAVAPAPVKIFNAAANSGMGQVDVSTTLNLTLPGNAFTGSYSSTITIAVISGP
jgi:hypothetical protein